jgi:hypothetical protein
VEPEYPAVVIPVMTQHYAMLQRNLLYTGVTRGKRLVVLVGQKKAVVHWGYLCLSGRRSSPLSVLNSGDTAAKDVRTLRVSGEAKGRFTPDWRPRQCCHDG